MTHNAKQVLATLAAHGILNHNAAVAMPDSFTLDQVTDRCDLGTATVRTALEWLEEQGFVRSRDTSYYDYGDHYMPGVVVWSVTAEGLVALWA